jgi:hypothetical protein
MMGYLTWIFAMSGTMLSKTEEAFPSVAKQLIERQNLSSRSRFLDCPRSRSGSARNDKSFGSGCAEKLLREEIIE